VYWPHLGLSFLGVHFSGARDSRPFFICRFPGLVMANSHIKRECSCNVNFNTISHKLWSAMDHRVGRAECVTQSPPTAKRCPVPSQPHTFTPPFIKSWLLRLQVVTTGPHHGPQDGASCIDSYQQWLSTQQCPMSSATVSTVTCREWPLWLAVSLPVWPFTL